MKPTIFIIGHEQATHSAAVSALHDAEVAMLADIHCLPS